MLDFQERICATLDTALYVCMVASCMNELLWQWAAMVTSKLVSSVLKHTCSSVGKTDTMVTAIGVQAQVVAWTVTSFCTLINI